jgi:hypothetical protein
MIAALAGGTDFPVLALDASNGLVMYGGKQASNAVGYNALVGARDAHRPARRDLPAPASAGRRAIPAEMRCSRRC